MQRLLRASLCAQVLCGAALLTCLVALGIRLGWLHWLVVTVAALLVADCAAAATTVLLLRLWQEQEREEEQEHG